MPLLHRLARIDHASIAFTLDGVACEGRAGADNQRVGALAHGRAPPVVTMRMP